MPGSKSLLLPLALTCALAAASPAHADRNASYSFDTSGQLLTEALKQYAQTTNQSLIFTENLVNGVRANTLKGNYTAETALAELLKGTGLVAVRNTAGALQIRKAGEQKSSMESERTAEIRVVRVGPDTVTQPAAVIRESSSENEQVAQSADQSLEDSRGIPEILVKGSRSSNTDIRRTEDDVQPYVVFDAEEIQRSMASNLEQFLKTRLPMNQSRTSEGQKLDSVRGNQSSIDLRGLGADQTLILVDGRRMVGVSSAIDFTQADINGIPLSAVERIEILPSTAGGIYGGGATGGVVNVILKRDLNDAQVVARYDGTFEGGGSQRQLDASAGFDLEGGRTQVTAFASYRDGKPLYIGDRDFLARSLALNDQNNHAFFYTSPQVPHGTTTNIRSTDGSNLVLVNGMRPLNSPIAHVPVGYAGPASDNGTAFLGTADRFNLTPANDMLGNRYSLLNTPDTSSLQLRVRRQFTDSIEAFVEASRYDNSIKRYGWNSDVQSVSNLVLPVGPNNPFAQSVTLSVPVPGYDLKRLSMVVESWSQQATGGVILKLPRQWMVNADYSLSWSENNYWAPGKLLTPDGVAALGDGRLNPLSDASAYPQNYAAFYPIDVNGVIQYRAVDQKDARLQVSGPLWTLPGGPLRLAALLERRDYYTEAHGTRQGATDGQRIAAVFPTVGAITDSAYMELNAPLVSAVNARPGLLSLDLLASYRHDGTKSRSAMIQIANPGVTNYRTGETTGDQYTLGFSYSPVQSMTLRVSTGRGILPPSVGQLYEVQLPPDFAALILGGNGLLDPKRGGLPVDASVIEELASSGGVPLRPEQSVSWSGGLILTPAAVPGFRLSLDYTRIEKTDEITFLGYQERFDMEDDLPGVIVRDELTPADAALGYTGGLVRKFSLGEVNIAKTLTEAFDVQADYQWDTRMGSFAANVMVTLQPHLSMQAAPGGQEVDRVGYADGVLKWRGNAGLRWNRGPWDLGWNMQYYDASRIYATTDSYYGPTRVLNQGGAWIPSQTYHDVYGRYRFENASGFAGGMLADTDLQLSVQNVLNTSPPILTNIYYFPSAGYATEGDARLRRYAISFTKRFGR